MFEASYGLQKRQFAPDVLDALIPAAEAMIDVINAEKHKPQMGDLSDNREYRKVKARCVHRVLEYDPEYRTVRALERKVRPMGDGKTYRCDLCKAKLLTKLDETAKKKLTDAIEVIDTIVAFGPDLGLINVDPAHPDEKPIIESMIDIKQFFALHLLPLADSMIKTMALETAYQENDRNNFTSEYLDRTKKATAIFN